MPEKMETMIKITKATYLRDHKIKLEFSDNSFSDFDFSYLLQKDTSLTNPLKNKNYFKDFFLELGGLCWRNRLSLSPSSLYKKAKEAGTLHRRKEAA